MTLIVVIPARGGNGLLKPLDSSAFVPDAALPPRRLEQAAEEGGPGVNIVLRGANEALLRRQYAAILRLI